MALSENEVALVEALMKAEPYEVPDEAEPLLIAVMNERAAPGQKEALLEAWSMRAEATELVNELEQPMPQLLLRAWYADWKRGRANE